MNKENFNSKDVVIRNNAAGEIDHFPSHFIWTRFKNGVVVPCLMGECTERTKFIGFTRCVGLLGIRYD